MLPLELILQIKNLIEHYKKEKMKECNFLGLRAKTVTLQMIVVTTKKQKYTKKCVMKRKRKFKNYKNCLETTQLDNKINHLEKNKITIDSMEKYCRIHKKQ